MGALPVGALSGVCTGWRQYETSANWWDVHAGRDMPDVRCFTGASVDVWETLADDLTQSRWAPSTRSLYQGWLRAFLLFCNVCRVESLPIDPWVFREWLTRIATNYAHGTVQIAASAVIGFCAMNNFKNPLEEHPACKLVVKATKRIRCGASKAQRAALDATFILDMWRALAEMRARAPLSIKQRRARCFTQLAFEGALRGGELAALVVCDLAFVACGPRCGLSCGSHVGSDAYVLCRLHKTSQAGSVKVVRLVAPERPTVVDGEPVSAVFCLENDWLPFLRKVGRTRHPACRSTFSTKFRCELCPALFCTFPSRPNGVVNSIDISAVTEAFKKFAVLTLRDPSGYSSHSGRIGSFSDATALETGVDEEMAALSLGWRSARTPVAVYKRKSQAEARATGLALAGSLVAAAESSGPKRVLAGASTVPAAVESVGRRAPAIPPVALRTVSAPQSGARPFPLRFSAVGGQAVCVGYQLGSCLDGKCPKAHVCHECGRRHQSGALCKGALRTVAKWVAETAKVSREVKDRGKVTPV